MSDKLIEELKENAVYIIKDGKIKEVDIPGDGFGKQVIFWQDGKPLYYEINYTKR